MSNKTETSQTTQEHLVDSGKEGAERLRRWGARLGVHFTADKVAKRTLHQLLENRKVHLNFFRPFPFDSVHISRQIFCSKPRRLKGVSPTLHMPYTNTLIQWIFSSAHRNPPGSCIVEVLSRVCEDHPVAPHSPKCQNRPYQTGMNSQKRGHRHA